jgi:broad specificity phosphatase PhoE
MATIYLLRHVESTANSAGVLAGRMPAVSLSRIGNIQITHIYSSPMQRCLETIEPYAKRNRKRVRKAPNFIEMDYGDWSGRKLSELRSEKLWRKIQSKPSQVRFPNGESFRQMQDRIEKGLNRLAKEHKRAGILIVSHGDPIKVVIATALGVKLDDFQKIVVDPGSLTIVDWPSRTLLGSNIPMTGSAKIRAKVKAKGSLARRRVLGGGTNA